MKYFTRIQSPVGQLTLVGSATHLEQVFFERDRRLRSIDPTWEEDPRPLREAKRQLKAYFAKRLTDFDLDLAPEGTAFQKSVWKALLRIPYGQTASYGDVARWIRKPSACRAVGAANGQNPIPIILPCHRVIGSSGKLTGYGGGLPRKQALLTLEGYFMDLERRAAS